MTPRNKSMYHILLGYRIRKVVTGVFAATVLSAGVSVSVADEIKWVGFQAGPPGGLGIEPFSAAPFFDSANWFNYYYPGETPNFDDNPLNDIAIFDESFDPQGNGMPFNIYFGDFVVPAVTGFTSSKPVSGGDAVVNGVEVRDGAFNFYFTDQYGTPQGSLDAIQHITVGSGGKSASLKISGGVLTQSSLDNWDGLVVGQGFGSTGRLIVDGVNSEALISRDVWIGNGGGTGYVDVINGGFYAHEALAAALTEGQTESFRSST
jgi:hypothetical protein